MLIAYSFTSAEINKDIESRGTVSTVELISLTKSIETLSSSYEKQNKFAATSSKISTSTKIHTDSGLPGIESIVELTHSTTTTENMSLLYERQNIFF